MTGSQVMSAVGVAPCLAHGVAHGGQRVGRDGGFEVGIAIPEHRADVESFFSLDHTPGAAVADLKTRQFHRDVLVLDNRVTVMGV